MPESAIASPAATVRRRHVFYVSGFDPQGPSHYHRLYADEAPKQAAVGGYEIEVGPRRRVSELAAAWSVSARFGTTPPVETTVEFLRWDDLVRAHWPRSRWQVMLGALGSTARQVGNGVLWRILRTSWPAFLVLALPPVLVLALLAAACLLGIGSGLLALHGHLIGALALAGVGGAAWYRFGLWAEARVQMAWLMRSTRFILRQARGTVPALEARLDAFGARIAEVWRSGTVDEVLVVGHSSGAMGAVSGVARALAAAPAGCGAVPDRLSMLTLGECIPMLSYQPEASDFRAELARLAREPRIDWIDVTAPPDGCCFALVDPTAAALREAGAHSGAEWRSPKRLSARFAQMFDGARYAPLRRDKYRCHFQYLMAGERPTEYDYFAITAGPLRLSERFAGAPSVTGFRQFQTFGGPDE